MNDIILQIRFLNKCCRSTISSSEFQQAFVDASVGRLALMICDEVDGTVFLTQENQEECFRYLLSCGRHREEDTHTVVSADGLVCVIGAEEPGRGQRDHLLILALLGLESLCI